MNGTLWQRLIGGVIRLHEQPNWGDFAGEGWVNRIMLASVSSDFHAKQGRTTGRVVLERSGRRLVVYLKRHYHLGFLRGILSTLWPGVGWSPAFKEWRNIQLSRSLGLAVPREMAAAEFIGPWCRLQSLLAVEELTGMIPLHEAVPEAARMLPPRSFREWKKGLTLEIARIVGELHAHSLYHKDLYLCHFFVDKGLLRPGTVWRNQVHLIDFHRFGRHVVLRWRWQLKDLAQLLYSCAIEGIDARDLLQFWRAYRGRQRRSFWSRFTRRLVVMKCRHYQRHNDDGQHAKAA